MADFNKATISSSNVNQENRGAIQGNIAPNTQFVGTISTNGQITGNITQTVLRGKDGMSVTHEWDGTSLIITSANGSSSSDLKGDSAYDVAVKNGFTGSEREWLRSINVLFDSEPLPVGRLERGLIINGELFDGSRQMSVSFPIDKELNMESENPVQNKIISQKLKLLEAKYSEQIELLVGLLKEIRDILDEGDLDKAINLLDTFLLDKGAIA